MTEEKTSFLDSLLLDLSSLVRHKFSKGADEHNQPLDEIPSLFEAKCELTDAYTYLHNVERVLRKVDGLLADHKINEARVLIQKQIDHPVITETLPSHIVKAIAEDD